MGLLDSVLGGLGDDAAGGLSDLLKGQGGVAGLAAGGFTRAARPAPIPEP